MQDWNYVFESCCEITVELSMNKNPPYSTIPDFWNQNREAMLAYLQAIHNGVKGYVYDSQKNPLFAYILGLKNPSTCFLSYFLFFFKQLKELIMLLKRI